LTAHDWVLILIGALISIPIGIASPLGTDWIKERRGLRNVKNALRRRDELTRSLARVTELANDTQKLNGFLLGRILHVIILMVAQILFDSAISLLSFVNYGLHSIEFNGITGLIAGIIDVVILIRALNIGIRTRRVYRIVLDYDNYKNSVIAELEAVNLIIGTGDQESQPSA
jgi:hypothetical protein